MRVRVLGWHCDIECALQSERVREREQVCVNTCTLHSVCLHVSGGVCVHEWKLVCPPLSDLASESQCV